MTAQRKIVPVILSGGSGTRLWPLSRAKRPKQFIELIGDNSLFQQTLLRVASIPEVSAPLIVCNNEHRFLVAEQMQELGITAEAIILEPIARNTAPAIATAATHISRQEALADSLLLILPADHLMRDAEAFQSAIDQARGIAASGSLVTFGITPSRAATGYGYIQCTADTANTDAPVRDVKQFVEKPGHSEAEQYLKAGGYYWNSGMFLFDPEVCLSQMNQHCPEVPAHVSPALDAASVDLDFLRLDTDHYRKCPDLSIDYGLMEHAGGVKVVPMDAGWTDIGSWTSLWESGTKDAGGNVTHGDVVLENVHNSYIHAEHRLVTALGVEDLIIVETHDGLMVTTKQHDQDIKKLVDKLKQSERPETELHRKVFRPWGNYDSVDNGHRFQVKRIVVKPGECTSMQKHHHRAEHWVVVFGTAEVTCGDRTFLLPENESVFIPLGETHRLKNPGKLPLEVIEVQSGSYLGEDDIVRTDDEYGRS